MPARAGWRAAIHGGVVGIKIARRDVPVQGARITHVGQGRCRIVQQVDRNLEQRAARGRRVGMGDLQAVGQVHNRLRRQTCAGSGGRGELRRHNPIGAGSVGPVTNTMPYGR